MHDNGPGITPENVGEVFAPFIQLSQVRARGHGLGLSIVRRIVERLGGEVGVEANASDGQGSTFYFTLPAVPECTPFELARSETGQSPQDLSK